MSSSYFSLAFSLLTIAIIAGLTVETNQEKVDTYNVLQRARRAPIWPFFQEDRRDSLVGKAVRLPFDLTSEALTGPARIAKGAGNFFGGLVDGVLGVRRTTTAQPSTTQPSSTTTTQQPTTTTTQQPTTTTTQPSAASTTQPSSTSTTQASSTSSTQPSSTTTTQKSTTTTPKSPK